MMSNSLEISSISKSFKNKKVLDNVSITVESNTVFGLIGMNGQGKTTLIKILLNLIQADLGKIRIFNTDNSYVKSREKLSYLPEKFIPSMYFKGREFIEYNLSLYKKKYNKNAVQEICNRLSFEYKDLNRMIKYYSKGMGQKLGLMTSFLCETPLMVLDEPMSGLDPRARIDVKNIMKEYIGKGNTIFLTSHILSDIDEICDKIAILNQGKIIFNATPKQFKEGYSNLEEAFLDIVK